MTIEVRRATADDTAELAALAEITFALACPPESTPEEIDAFVAENLSEEAFARYLADPARIVLVAEDAEAAVGYTMLVAGTPSDQRVDAAVRLRPTIELSKVYVHAEAHGGGTAAALMRATLEAAASSGAAGVWLGVNGKNARAIRFYEKSGFQRVGTRTFSVGGRIHDDLVMERPLR